jgi:hypothetical protein
MPLICPRVDPSRFRWQRLSNSVWLYNTGTDIIYETNEAGLEIVGLFDGQHTCRQVAERIAALYSCSTEAILADVMEFAAALARHAFVG